MEKYKKERFPGLKNGVKWEFQNEHWEKDYAQFIERKTEEDLDLVEEAEEW